jgi:hypothetical protein
VRYAYLGMAQVGTILGLGPAYDPGPLHWISALFDGSSLHNALLGESRNPQAGAHARRPAIRRDAPARRRPGEQRRRPAGHGAGSPTWRTATSPCPGSAARSDGSLFPLLALPMITAARRLLLPARLRKVRLEQMFDNMEW